MRRRLGLVAVAVMTAAVSGCALGGTTTATPSAAATPSYSPSPMTVVQVTLPAARSGAPSLATTGSSWLGIVTSLSAYGQWILGSPDPSTIAGIAMPGCAVSNLLTAQVTGLLNSNAYVKTTAPVITSVIGPSAAVNVSQVVLTVIASRASEPVISNAKSATTISTFPAQAQTSLEVTLYLGADKKWRFCTIEDNADDGAPANQAVPLI